MFQILTKRIEILHFELPWLARFWSSINPVLIADTRGRPACWLFCASCVVFLCSWYPYILMMEVHDPLFARIVTGIEILYTPFKMAAPIVALFNYVILWRRARKQRGTVSRWLLSVGSVLLLIALLPALVFITVIIVAIILQL
jgi:hypothetical protein